MEHEFNALDKLAFKERRRPEAQAAVVIRDALIQLGLLKKTDEIGNHATEDNHEPTTRL